MCFPSWTQFRRFLLCGRNALQWCQVFTQDWSLLAPLFISSIIYNGGLGGDSAVNSLVNKAHSSCSSPNEALVVQGNFVNRVCASIVDIFFALRWFFRR